MGSRTKADAAMRPERYRPMMSDAQARRRIDWQDGLYEEHLRRPTKASTQFLDRRLDVPSDVFQPEPYEFNLLARTVLKEVRESDVVLDMGTGSGIQAILAASKAAQVLAVDINPQAVACARKNVARNNLAHRVQVRRSDLFDKVRGRFDLILFDPPFRWTKPRDLWEQSTADEGYRTLQRFFSECGEHLTETGRIIIHFGTSGDLAYVQRLIRQNGFRRTQLLKTRHPKGWKYLTYRVTDARG